jgi:hypothetical protein
MVVRDKKYGILIFEASSLSGVSLNPWNCMIKYGWYKYINRFFILLTKDCLETPGKCVKVKVLSINHP